MRSTEVRFAVVSLLPILMLGWFLHSTVRTALESRTAQVYGSMTQVLFRMASDVILQPEDFERDAPLPPERRVVVEGLLQRLSSEKADVRVRFVTPSGRVLYANRAEDETAPVPQSEWLDTALAGEPATRFVKGALRADGKRANVIELYIPVRFSDDGQVYGAIVASGIDGSVVATIDGDLRRMHTMLGIGLAALWLALLPISTSVSRRLRRKSQENEYLALHDTLTGLPNRNLLTDRLAHAIAATTRTGDSVGLLLIDLDGFKDVNDTLGHGKGDELLERVAERLSTSVRAEDTVARLGGDEFAIVVANLGDVLQLDDVAQRVTHALSDTVPVDGIDVAIQASIGGSIYPLHAADAEQLLQHADIAMYAAKATDETFVLYSAEIDSHSPTRLALSADMRRALLVDNQLLLHYQPVADPVTGEIAAMEALVRWNHPKRGLLSPAEFIPMAEQSGLVRGLSTKVLDMAIGQVCAWRRDGLDLSIAVNLSAGDLRSKSMLDEIRAALDKHGLPADRLEIEVTETGILADPEAAVRLVRSLRELGVRIALDDFGTGYSSLTYLKRLRPDRLKIDRGFVDAMLNEQTDAAIVRSLIELAHGLSIGVTAEGVETQEHWDLLRDLSCDLVQGFFLARPLAPDAATRWLRERVVARLGSAVG